ncbi:O-antigen ligase family protein [Aestuariivivens marinum]|uniref:O-antigen ligase family protein n=1 Tax=Aestuariivivens marinum TaxID=2913555 RepID=UPI001F59476A|nr:O-antigen ligase family protein [Aestuariivivens marinum]
MIRKQQFKAKIFLIQKELPYLLLCMLVLYPIFPNAFQSFFLVLFFSSCFFYYKERILVNLKEIGVKPLVLVCSWFLFLSITLFYTEDLALGFKRLVRMIHVVLFPFIFLLVLPALSKKKIRVLSNLFIFVHVFLGVFLLIKCFEGINRLGFRGVDGTWVYNISDQGFLELLKEFSKMSFAASRYFINENEISTFFIHKAYLSLGFAWCFFLSINEVFSKNSTLRKVIYTLLVIFFFCSIIYFTSIPNILALILLFPLYIILKLDNFKKGLVFISICFFSVFTILQVQSVNEKVFGDRRLLTDINEAKNLISSIVEGKEMKDTNVRYNVWSCSFENIKKNFWFGIGVGDEEAVLKECYQKKDCEYCAQNNLNTHNYYASLMLSGGVFVLGLFLVALLYQITVGYRTGNILLVIFILLFAINLISENMLSRINGVLFYSMFSGLMLNQSFNFFKESKVNS